MDVAYAPGSLVAARGREWVVLPDSDDELLVLRPLGGSDDEIAAVFPDLEPVTQARFSAPSPDDLGDAQAAGLLRTALRIGFRSSAGPFRSLASIAVEPRSYQLVPLLMAMRQQAVRLAICDDVGLGKTIESGLIAAELLAQGEAKGLAVLCSPALAEQWQGELRRKFGIDAELVLASTVPRLERALAYGQSLFEKHRIVVVSADFIKSPRHRDDFIKHCPDLVIVDEAHTFVPTDGRGAKSAQLRYELLVRLAADRERHLLLVTATPHSGKDDAFRSLLGLLDPALAGIDLGTDEGRRRLAPHYVQRRRNSIRKYLDEETEFPSDRLFKDEAYTLSPGYRAVLDDAIAYASEQVTDATGKREQRVAWWSAIALLRSMVSSPRAAAATLQTRAQAAAGKTAEEADALGWPVTADMAEDEAADIDAPPGAEAAPSPVLSALAERAADLEGPDGDRKLALLVKHVSKLLKDGYNPIVFCRYIPTADYVAEHLDGALGRKTMVASVTGTLSPAQRIDRIDSLTAAAEDEGARCVLVATDCLSEGVNLQHSFNAVVHYDLAWNPTRHEQREGRVDRFGQRSPQVRVVTIYGSDNGIDGKVLEVLVKKHREIRKATGISVPVPDETSSQVTNAIVEWLLLRGKGQQQALFGDEQVTLFDLDEVVSTQEKELQTEWNSMAERESRARSRFEQGSIHPDEVAGEVAQIRAALGTDAEVRSFVRTSLQALGAELTAPSGDDFTVMTASLPAGLRDGIYSLVGERLKVPFGVNLAVSRGEAALTRTDPIVGAVAHFVMSAALDRALDDRLRPARRCGVVRTRAVTKRTTVLLVRYRFQMNLPGRYGDTPVIAEDARVLGFSGSPASAQWLPDDEAAALLTATADANTLPELARQASSRVLSAVDELMPHVNRRGEEFAEELREAHRRVRRSVDQAVRGVRVTLQGDADILGAYIYLPFQGA